MGWFQVANGNAQSSACKRKMQRPNLKQKRLTVNKQDWNQLDSTQQGLESGESSESTWMSQGLDAAENQGPEEH